MRVHISALERPLGLLLIGLVCLLTPLAGAGQTLASRIEAAMHAKDSLQSTAIGIDVREVPSGASIYSSGGRKPMIPASNMKLLTTGAALRVLGPDAVFETAFGWDGDRIVIIGDGDPGLGDPALLDRNDPPMTVDDQLAQIARELAAAGPGRVGEIVLDSRIFDENRVHPTWPRDQLNKWYCAEVAGLNFHTNVLTFYLSTGGDRKAVAGVTPIVRLEPAVEGVGRWISIDNKAKTVAKGRHTAWVARAVGTRAANEFTIFGDVRLGASAGIDAAVHDPPVFLGSLLGEHLAAVGVEIPLDDEGRPVVRGARPEEAFDAFAPAVVVRTAMPDILQRANTNSQNLYAEALIKRLAFEVTHEPGSWKSGAAVIRMLITDDLGPEMANTTTIDDGSGLSRGNRVAPGTLTAWLADLAGRPGIGDAFLESLPEPGEGTLRHRFKGDTIRNHVYAKSGSINGVRCLSGYVIADNGNAVAFSVMVNNITHGRQIRDALELHEGVVLAIDSWISTLPAKTPETADALGG